MANRNQSSQEFEIENVSHLIKATVVQHFGQLADPRRANSTTYSLVEIIFITICAVTGAVTNWGRACTTA